MFIILLIPILVYIYKFGIGFWEQPEEWAALGSYVGGVYTPILSFITLAVISTQMFLQHQQFQHSLIQHQEEQIKEYLDALEDALCIKIGESSSRDFLVKLLRDITKDDVDNIPVDLVMKFNEVNHRLYSMWCQVVKCLAMLENISNQNVYNRVVFASNKNKVLAYLNPQTCRMLDRYHYVFMRKCEQSGLRPETNEFRYYYSDLRIGG